MRQLILTFTWNLGAMAGDRVQLRHQEGAACLMKGREGFEAFLSRAMSAPATVRCGGVGAK